MMLWRGERGSSSPNNSLGGLIKPLPGLARLTLRDCWGDSSSWKVAWPQVSIGIDAWDMDDPEGQVVAKIPLSPQISLTLDSYTVLKIFHLEIHSFA